MLEPFFFYSDLVHRLAEYKWTQVSCHLAGDRDPSWCRKTPHLGLIFHNLENQIGGGEKGKVLSLEALRIIYIYLKIV